MTRELKFWGVRGTFPAPGPYHARYGGHTPCASVETPAGVLVVDAGSGLRDLGLSLEASNAPPRVTLLLTHFHLDHIMGFPFFGPLLMEGAEIAVFAPAAPAEIRQYLAALMAAKLFPIDLEATKARTSFHRFEEGLIVGGVRVTSCPLRHPQGSVAYRLEGDEGSIVFATDTEPPETGFDERLAAFAAGTTHLVCDATYTPEEYAAGKKGWGHGTWRDAVEVGRASGARNVYLSHHNPDHEDICVRELVEAARNVLPCVTGARQGMELIW